MLINLLLYYFPFQYSPINVSNKSLIDVSFLNSKVLKRIIIKNGHFFYENGDKVRFFGTNLIFDDCFPNKTEAPLLAKRMAQIGFNIIRFHQMDKYSIFKSDMKTIDPEKIELLHYFLYQLKINGIYANINLHVGWSYPGLDNFSTYFLHGKGLDRFYDPFINYQKEYAYAILNSFNNYTGFKLSEDPQICFVELNNENSIEIVYQQIHIIRGTKFGKSLLDKWRNYLENKYLSFDNMKRVLKFNPINSTNFLENKAPFFQFESKKIVNRTISYLPEKNYYLDIQENGTNRWSYQFIYMNIKFEEFTPYKFCFSGMSSISETLILRIQGQNKPWTIIMEKTIQITSNWSNYSGEFFLNKLFNNSIGFYVTFDNSKHFVQLTNFSIFKGINNSYLNINSINEIEFPNSSYFLPLEKDFRFFFIETEYNNQVILMNFLKNNLSLTSLITNSQPGYSYSNLFSLYRESQLSDFIDDHSYWDHPKFEDGYQWSRNRFSIHNKPMVNSPLTNSLTKMFSLKYENKPYTISEYDHSFPNEYTQEMFPMLISFASFQDWDAIYHFTYNLKNRNESIDLYFTMSINPNKMSMTPISALVYRNFLLDSSLDTVTNILPLEKMNFDLNTKFPKYNQILNYRMNYLIDSKIQNRFVENGTEYFRISSSNKSDTNWNQWPFKTNQIEWYGDNNTNIFKVNAPIVKMSTGFFQTNLHQIGNFEFKMNLLKNETVSIALVSMDSLPIESSKKMILTVVGIVKNSNQNWNENRTSINYGWGYGPVLTKFYNYDIYIPGNNKINVFVLNPDGEENGTLPVKYISNKWKFSSDINNPTVIYFISREEDNYIETNYLKYSIISLSLIIITIGLILFLKKYFHHDDDIISKNHII